MVLQMKIGSRPFATGSVDYLFPQAAVPAAVDYEAVLGFSVDFL